MDNMGIWRTVDFSQLAIPITLVSFQRARNSWAMFVVYIINSATSGFWDLCNWFTSVSSTYSAQHATKGKSCLKPRVTVPDLEDGT
jgi:hypothetical protein